MTRRLLCLAGITLAVAANQEAAHLVTCTDDGPFACDDPECPSPSLSCPDLSKMGLCMQTFAAIWDHGAPPGTETAVVHERCPRACDRCGVLAPDACNMARIDASNLSADELAAALLQSTSPVVIGNALSEWVDGSYAALLGEHAQVPINVIEEGGRVRGEAKIERAVTFGDYMPSMRNGSLPGSAYVFFELGGVRVEAHEGEQEFGGFALAGADVSPAARRLVHAVPGGGSGRVALLEQWLSAVVRKQVEAAPTANARLLLSAGSWGNGRPFHAHGPALLALLSGVKRWFIKRPNASFAWQTFELTRDASLAASAELPRGWEEQLWQCSQRVGELLWVPDLMHHATLNYASDVTGLTLVMDDLSPLTPLHEAAQAGSAETVSRILASGEYPIDVRAGGGATPLHYAAGLGHCDAMEALLKGGAALHVRAAGGHQPLHLAVAAGHAEAVELLLRRGADLSATDQHGFTPLALARQLGHSALVRALEEAEARAS